MRQFSLKSARRIAARFCALWLLLAVARPAFALQAQAANQSETLSVTLQLAAGEDAKSVTVAGSFNGWNKDANRLVKSPDGKTWRIALNLEPDIYFYKFVVNGEKWLTDPNAPQQNDGNGNVNSVLTVAPAGYDKPGKKGDGQITEAAVRHVVNSRYVVRVDKSHFTLTLRTRHSDIEEADVWLAERGLSKMTLARSDALFDYWRAVVETQGSATLTYRLTVRDGKTTRWAQPNLPPSDGKETARPFVLQMKDFPVFDTPDWARDAVFYQIFPDRFANGDKSNDPKDVQAWGAKPNYFAWMGGDLRGVIQHTAYLKELGINALYFNPIFAARSNHGYDTTDYLKVDPRFGTNEELKELTAAAHKQGWRVILDAVFNHTGVDFAGFQSLRTEGEKSPYRNWYFVHGFPIEIKDGQKNYDGWYGSPWMPKLNVLNPETRDYLLGAATRWIREANIDGWRLDAADEVNPELWKQFRKAVRAAKPDAYIVGERWNDATAWLKGDQWDAAMNYPWCFAVRDFFASDKMKPSEFDTRMARLRDAYPPAATAVMFNILDSHDTDRIRTACGDSLAKEFQAVLFQMTYPGTPCVYYGDEIGMEGGRDPDNRRGMEWEKATPDNPALTFYKKAIALRNQHICLRRGEFRTVLADDAKGLFGFTREGDSEIALVVFNRSDKEQRVVIPASALGKRPAQDWIGTGVVLSREGENLTFSLPPRGYALLGATAK